MAEAAWRWVLDQVRWDDGPWIPESAGISEISEYRDTMYSGVGGLAYVLAEIRFARDWTAEERGVAEAIVEWLTGRIEDEIDCSLFGGLVSSIGVLTALEVPGAQAAVDRLIALRTRDGWPQTAIGPPGSCQAPWSTMPLSARPGSCSARCGPGARAWPTPATSVRRLPAC
ncbi:hypothetical protein [Amycolatopsis magusensis]|uniref:hypothetical protein n=1 Tax=Amycolatopsis magusensis TaxID=882444 RepID=UPI0024A8DEB1|nr:hypothetical protein [Amycolatopsis magusensis]MDI5976087.1 hypothetical protein [Amycolatopsis magusensis]